MSLIRWRTSTALVLVLATGFFSSCSGRGVDGAIATGGCPAQ